MLCPIASDPVSMGYGLFRLMSVSRGRHAVMCPCLVDTELVCHGCGAALACVLRAVDDIFEPKIFIRLAYFINMAYLCHAFERKGFSGA